MLENLNEIEKILVSHGWDASVWTKHGYSRLYLNKLPDGTKSAAFIENGEIKNYFTKQQKELLFAHIEEGVVENKKQYQEKPTSFKTPKEVQKAIRLGRQVKDSDIDSSLDRLYGKGNWDRWDREDFEG